MLAFNQKNKIKQCFRKIVLNIRQEQKNITLLHKYTSGY